MTRQQHSLNLCLGSSGSFHRQCQDLVHPRLHLGLNDGLFEAGDHFLVLPVSNQIVHGLADGFGGIGIRREPLTPPLGSLSGSFTTLLRSDFGTGAENGGMRESRTQNKRSGRSRNRLPPLRIQFNSALLRLESFRGSAGDHETRFFFIASSTRLSSFGPCGLALPCGDFILGGNCSGGTFPNPPPPPPPPNPPPPPCWPPC